MIRKALDNLLISILVLVANMLLILGYACMGQHPGNKL